MSEVAPQPRDRAPLVALLVTLVLAALIVTAAAVVPRLLAEPVDRTLQRADSLHHALACHGVVIAKDPARQKPAMARTGAALPPAMVDA